MIKKENYEINEKFVILRSLMTFDIAHVKYLNEVFEPLFIDLLAYEEH